MRNLPIMTANNAGRYSPTRTVSIANMLGWPITRRLLTSTTTLRRNIPDINSPNQNIAQLNKNKIDQIRREQVAANLAFLVPPESAILSSPATVLSKPKKHTPYPAKINDASAQDLNVAHVLSVLNNKALRLAWFHECLKLIGKYYSESHVDNNGQFISSDNESNYEAKIIQLLKENKANLTSLEIGRIIKNLYHKQMHGLIRLIYLQVLSSIPSTQALPTVTTINYIMTASLLLPSEYKWRVCEDIFARYLSSPDLAYTIETFNLMLKYYTRVDMRLSKELFQQIVSSSTFVTPNLDSLKLVTKTDEIKLDRYTILIYLNGLRIKSRDLKAMKEVFNLSRKRLGEYNIFVCKEMLQGYLELCQNANEFESFLTFLENTPHPQHLHKRQPISLKADKEIQLILMRFYFSSRAGKFGTSYGPGKAFEILDKLLNDGINVPYKYYQHSITQLAHNNNNSDTLTSMTHLIEIMTRRSGYSITRDHGIIGSLIYAMSKDLNNNDAMVVIEDYLDRVTQILSQLVDTSNKCTVSFGGIQHIDAVLLLVKIFLEKYPFLRNGFLRRVRSQIESMDLKKNEKSAIANSKYYNLIMRQILKLTKTNGFDTSSLEDHFALNFKNVYGNTVPLRSAVLSNSPPIDSGETLVSSNSMWRNLSRFNVVERYTNATQDKELEVLAYEGHRNRLILQRLETRLRGDMELSVSLVIRILKGMERNGTNLSDIHKVLSLLKDYDQAEILKSIKLLILKFQLKRIGGMPLGRRLETTSQKLNQFYLNSKKLGPLGLNLHELHFLALQYLKLNQPLVAFELLTNDARAQIFELVGIQDMAPNGVIDRRPHQTVSAELSSSIRSIYMLLMRTVFEVMRTHSPIEERGTYLTVDDVVDLPTETTEEILDKYNMAFTSTEISEIKLALEQLRAQPSDEPFVELQEKDNLVKLLHIVHEYTTLTISYLSPDTQGSDQSKTQVHGDLPSVLMTKQWKKFFLELLDHYSQNKDKARFLIMFSLLKKLNVSTQHLQENARYMGSRLTEIIHQLSKKE